MGKKQKIPGPTIKRMPLYFKCLSELKNSEVTIVSSEEISKRCGIKASQFRKDMSHFGEFGIQGLGYPVSHLLDRIVTIMQLNRPHDVVLVGAGNLGQALVRYPGIRKWGFRVKYLYDNDPDKIGKKINGIEIQDFNAIPQEIKASLGVIAVPPTAAQSVAEKLVQAGVKAILNFTSVSLKVPGDVVVRNVDLTNELAILTYYMETR